MSCHPQGHVQATGCPAEALGRESRGSGRCLVLPHAWGGVLWDRGSTDPSGGNQSYFCFGGSLSLCVQRGHVFYVSAFSYRVLEDCLCPPKLKVKLQLGIYSLELPLCF